MNKSQKKCSTNHELIQPKDFVIKMGGLLCSECRVILYQPGTPMFNAIRAYQLLQKEQLQPFGDVTLELEKVLEKMVHDHDLQWGEVLGQVYIWLFVHAESYRETYLDGTHPEFYYGPSKKG